MSRITQLLPVSIVINLLVMGNSYMNKISESISGVLALLAIFLTAIITLVSIIWEHIEIRQWPSLNMFGYLIGMILGSFILQLFFLYTFVHFGLGDDID